MEKYIETLVGFYPVSSKQENVLSLLEYAKAHMDKYNMQTKFLLHGGIHSLYAHPQGKEKSRLLLQAHIDIVPGENQPFRVENGRYYGRGTYDMLFATACYMRLLDELSESLSTLDLGIMLSGDEELGGFHGIEPFLNDGYETDVCILPDAGENFGAINTSAKGVYSCAVQINGKSHHGSRPWEGDGAAIKLVHFLYDLEQVFDTSSQDNTTMTVSILKSGDADNRGPSSAEATLDIRYSDKRDLSRVQQLLNEKLQEYDGQIINLIEGSDYQLDSVHPDVKTFLEVYSRHHEGPIEETKSHGSSDARFFAEKNIPVIMLRPKGEGAHGDVEWVSIEEVEKFYQLLKEYVIKLLQ